MNWRLKCLAFHVLNRIPFGHSIHGALQRHVTRRYFQPISAASLATPGYHIEQFKKLPKGSVALEFGAGRNLLIPLLLSDAGAGMVYAYDLNRLATIEQINGIIVGLRGLLPGDWPEIRSFDELREIYRVHYCAPADARATGLPDQSIDFIFSTAVLEHIPEPDIRAILRESIRIGAPKAKFSFIIDYHDHYGSADRDISLWNFYQFPERAWAKFNPSNHYQNRLRHIDYERIFADVGLEIVSTERVIPDWSEPSLDTVQVCDEFSRYSREDLLTASGRFRLRVPPASKCRPMPRRASEVLPA